MSSPLVSVIMPVYNSVHLIGHSIASVQAQTISDWELIIVDDGSTDNLEETVQSHINDDGRIRYIALDKNYGFPSKARNTGIKVAQGDWIALCDADDIWHTQKLEYQLRYLKSEGAEFCSTNMDNFRQLSEISDKVPPAEIELSTITFKMQLRRYRTATSSVVVKREILLQNLFKEDAFHHSREDIECFLKIHEEIGQSIRLEFPFLHYRVSATSLSGRKWDMIKKTAKILKVYELKNGRKLGWRAYWYTATHVFIGVFTKVLWGRM